ncbi:F-box domain-containing protein [Strongyloides ratti]|uniref:F-box domain-containing protein n=1 Tax=Strongyloides ratti TaxID=34506 RepID=A0A090L5T5_STRRB|nr:F-box domain-containing protein [Strongyloides ratti]CEF63482.1 F-box domain-containing protein [Strongyloides ratti]
MTTNKHVKEMFANILGRRGRKIFFEPSTIIHIHKKKHYHDIKDKSKYKKDDSQLIKMAQIPQLPDIIWYKILINISDPYDLIKMRKVSKIFKTIIDNYMQKRLYLNVFKMDLNEVLLDTVDKVDCNNFLNLPEENIRDGYSNGNYKRHKKCQILLSITSRNVVIVVDERWTNKDVQCIWNALKYFSRFSHTINLDCQIFELLSVALSPMKLSRWYTFECYLGSIGLPDADGYHMKPSSHNCGKTFTSCAAITGNHKNINNHLDPHLYVNLDDTYDSDFSLFEKCKELTIRTTPYDMGHLSRIPDYHVHFSNIFNPETIEIVRINLVNIHEKLPLKSKKVKDHLNIFKKWIEANKLGEKFVIQRND